MFETNLMQTKKNAHARTHTLSIKFQLLKYQFYHYIRITNQLNHDTVTRGTSEVSQDRFITYAMQQNPKP
jgi:hypothetical protein